jgi:hypothetical protein
MFHKLIRYALSFLKVKCVVTYVLAGFKTFSSLEFTSLNTENTFGPMFAFIIKGIVSVSGSSGFVF